MKKFVRSPIFAMFILFLSSCSESESMEPLPMKIGSWSLNTLVLLDFPTGFEDNSGINLPSNEIFSEYSLDILGNNTY